MLPLCLVQAAVFPTNAVLEAYAAAPEPLADSHGIQVLEEIQDAITRLAEHVTPTVVGVSAISEPPRPGASGRRGGTRAPGSGSGVVIHEDGYIVTNNHVVGAGTKAEIHFSDRSALVADVIGRDPDTDLALLKVHTSRALASATFGDSGTVKIGQWVLAVGNPFGLDRTVTLGVVSGIGRENMNVSRYENFIQTDASINPGNSGGPLFNLRGEVIGINTAIISFAQGIGFAIPSNMTNRIVRQLKTDGRVARGWLGVGVQPLPPQLDEDAEAVTDGLGVLVNEVFPGEPAARAGIRSGDIITHIGNERLTSTNQLSRVVAGLTPGDEVAVRVMRDGKPLRLSVFPGIRKDEPVTASRPPTDVERNLGISVAPLTEESARRFSLERDSGIVVTHVARGSIAYAEGLRQGDVIQEVNRAAVPTPRAFRLALAAVKPGETILLRIVREAKKFFVVMRPDR